MGLNYYYGHRIVYTYAYTLARATVINIVSCTRVVGASARVYAVSEFRFKSSRQTTASRIPSITLTISLILVCFEELGPLNRDPKARPMSHGRGGKGGHQTL